MSRYILAIDQGTTSSRAVIYTPQMEVVAVAQQEFAQHFPHDGWVEHNPEDIWHSVLSTCRQALEQAQIKAEALLAIGITNQRETVVVWDKQTGEPVCNAIVWQDRRTAGDCRQLLERGLEPLVQQRTGLIIDPYFSGTKLRWILHHGSGARAKAERGQLLFGTVDTYILWRLTKGRSHATDASNASRTLLFDIHRQDWDDELLAEFEIPRQMLPDVRDSAADFGHTAKEWLGSEVPVCSMLGDQHAALVGQACFAPGMLKSTYGTGCFAVVNTGKTALQSQHRLLTTVGYRLRGETTYALEGSIFMAGAIVQWLRDGLGVIKTAAETEELARGTAHDQPEIMVPAFTGLGAPYWDPDARAAIFGMSRNTGRKELAAAALNSVALQTTDLLLAMTKDGVDIRALRVDGGMTNNRHFLQVLASVTGVETLTSTTAEATAQGAAMLAGLQAGVFADTEALSQLWRLRERYQCELPEDDRAELYRRWQLAVAKVKSGGS